MAGDTKRNVSIVIKARDAASGALKGLKVGLVAVGAAAAAVTAAVAALGFAFSKAVLQARDQQVADVQLAGSLRAIGQNTKEVREEIEAFASEMQDLTTIDDRVIKANAGVIASMGNISGKGLLRATRAAVNLSAAMGTDIPAAARALGKAAKGITTGLTEYGIFLDKTKSKSEQFSQALDIIEGSFSGVAEAMGQTFQGRWDRLQNNLTDAIELIGDSVVKSEAFSEILDILSDSARGLQDDVKGSDDVMKDLSDTLAELTILLIQGGIAVADMGIGVAQFTTRGGGLITSLKKVGAWVKFAFDITPIGNIIKQITSFEEQLDIFPDAAAPATEEMSGMERSFQLLRDRLAEADERFAVLLEDLRAGKLGMRDVAAELGNTANAAGDTTDELTALDQAIVALGGKGLVGLEARAELVENAFKEAVKAFEIGDIETAEQFDRVVGVIKQFGEGVRIAGGDVEDFLTTTGRIPDEITTAFGPANEAIINLGITIQGTLQDQMSQAAQSFGDAVVETAFEGQRAWGDFFKDLIKGFAKAILKALILKAVTAGIGGLFGAGGGGGGGGLFGAGGSPFAEGAGPATGPLFAAAGAAVRRETPAAANQVSIGIFPAPDRLEQAAELAEAINELVERHGYRSIASEVLTSA